MDVKSLKDCALSKELRQVVTFSENLEVKSDYARNQIDGFAKDQVVGAGWKAKTSEADAPAKESLVAFFKFEQLGSSVSSDVDVKSESDSDES